MLNNLRLVELARPLVALFPQTVAAATPVQGVYLDLSNVHKLAIHVMVGATAGGTIVATMSQATSHGGGSAKALSFDAADVFDNATSGLFTRSTGLAGTLIIAASKQAIIDIDPSTLDINNGFNHVKVTLTGGTTGNLASACYVIKVPRISSNTAEPEILAT